MKISAMRALYLRMLGYSFTLVIHTYNIYTVNSMLEGPIMEDPNIRAFTILYMRFFTTWTMILQMIHAGMGLVCDYSMLRTGAGMEPKLLTLLRTSKDRIFAAVLWPTVFMCHTLFWSLYHYDRGLMYPMYADKLLSSTTNHIFHTAIVPIVVWELLLQPRTVPKSHTKNIAMLCVYMLTYLGVMYYTYVAQGIWLYPVFGLAYETMFGFPLILGIIGVKLMTYYYMQWFFTRLVYGTKTIKNN